MNVKNNSSQFLCAEPDFFLCLLVPPDPPVLELQEVKGSMISLAWTPGFEGDSPITGYYLESKAVNSKTTFRLA